MSATRAKADRFKTFERETFFSTLASFFFLPKAFPKDEKERFKLVLVEEGATEGRVCAKLGALNSVE